MATIAFRRGDVLTQTFAPVEADGTPTDLAGATAAVEISTPTACITLPLVAVADGFDWPLSDATVPAALLARAYPAQFVITWPDGQEDRDDFVFLVEGSC